MSKKSTSFMPFILGAWCLLCVAGRYAVAQWGTNAPPCPSHCSPASPWWGYTQTKWNRWPGAVYPDMIKPAGQTSGEEIPPAQIDLPIPNKESEIKGVSPTRETGKSPMPQTMPEENTNDSTGQPRPFAPSLEEKSDQIPPAKEAPVPPHLPTNRCLSLRILQIRVPRRHRAAPAPCRSCACAQEFPNRLLLYPMSRIREGCAGLPPWLRNLLPSNRCGFETRTTILLERYLPIKNPICCCLPYLFGRSSHRISMSAVLARRPAIHYARIWNPAPCCRRR